MVSKTNHWNTPTAKPGQGTNQREPRCPSAGVAKNLPLNPKYERFYMCIQHDKPSEKERRYSAARYCLLTRLHDMRRFANKPKSGDSFVRHKHVINLLIKLMKSCKCLPLGLENEIKTLRLKYGSNPSKTKYNRIISIIETNRNHNVSLVKKRLFH